MGKLRSTMGMSLDGFVAGPDQSVKDPLGVGGERLHDWMIPLAVFQEMHGEDGTEGEVNASTAVVRGWWENVGAVVMGRNMFGGGPGPWRGDWRGWWGENPPYHVPVFVITHHPREPFEMQGGTIFHFVTDGIEAALKQAAEAAGGRDVWLTGGASVIQQYLRAGLLTRSRSRWHRSSSATASACSPMWTDPRSSSSRSARSRRRASLTSATASSVAAEKRRRERRRRHNSG